MATTEQDSKHRPMASHDDNNKIEQHPHSSQQKNSANTSTTIQDLPVKVLGIPLSLIGVGHFRYGPFACKMLLKAYQDSVSFEKSTTAKSVTYSKSCAQQYFENEGSGGEVL